MISYSDLARGKEIQRLYPHNSWHTRETREDDGTLWYEYIWHSQDSHMAVYPVPLTRAGYVAYVHYDPSPYFAGEQFSEVFLTATEAQAWCIRQLALCRSERAALDVSLPV